ncbi:MAG: PorV/PorQ family protein [bacterium]
MKFHKKYNNFYLPVIISYFVFRLLLPEHISCGDYTADFLNIGVGARAVGMGSAFSSVSNDVSSFYWNPAGIAFLKKPVIGGMYGAQFGSFNDPLGSYHYLGGALPLPGSGGVISINWVRLSVNDIPVYSELAGDDFWDRLRNHSLRPSGEAEGFIHDTEDAFFFTFALMNKFSLDLGWDYHEVAVKMPVGINIKWIQQSLGKHEAKCIGIDIGTIIQFPLSDFFQSDKFGILNFGLNIQDITETSLKWDTEHADPLPTNYKTGISYLHELKWVQSKILIAYDHSTRWRGENNFGLELQFMNTINLRSGFHEGSFTGGAGVKFWKICLDYAFLAHNLDSLHRISFSITP